MLKFPGDTGGSWPTTPGRNGLICGITVGAGATLQGSPGSWQSGTFYSTATMAPFYATTNNQLVIAGDHLFVGQYNMPYKARQFDREMILARRFYQQSCPYGINCIATASPGLGGVDAITARLPYAGSTFASLNEEARFPVPMAISPTVTLFSSGAATTNCYDATTAADAGTASTVNLGPKGFSLQCAVTSSNALGDLLQAHWRADTGL